MREQKIKKETDTELLARLMADGFKDVKTRFDGIDVRLDGIDGRLDGIDGRLDGIDGRLDGIDGRLDGMSGQIISLEKGQTETHRRLDSIERKQAGMLESLDEAVHQSEFRKLVQRVEKLEVK